jgi:hypothetical protein
MSRRWQQCIAYVRDRWRAKQEERVRPFRGGGEGPRIAVVEGGPLDVTLEYRPLAIRMAVRSAYPKPAREARPHHLPADVSRCTADQYDRHDIGSARRLVVSALALCELDGVAVRIVGRHRPIPRLVVRRLREDDALGL